MHRLLSKAWPFSGFCIPTPGWSAFRSLRSKGRFGWPLRGTPMQRRHFGVHTSLPPGCSVGLASNGGLHVDLVSCMCSPRTRPHAEGSCCCSQRSINLWNGIGSVAGPLAGAILVSNFEINGVLYLMAGAAIVLMILTLGRRLVIARRRAFKTIPDFGPAGDGACPRPS